MIRMKNLTLLRALLLVALLQTGAGCYRPSDITTRNRPVAGKHDPAPPPPVQASPATGGWRNPDLVPDITKVGEQAYFQWFKENAVTPETLVFIESHRDALGSVLRTLRNLTGDLQDVSISTRKKPGIPNSSDLKRPESVEEKIYRDWLKSTADWKRWQQDNNAQPGSLPQNIHWSEARKMIFAAAPELPFALRDIAGTRVVVKSMADLNLMKDRISKEFQDRIIRYKDFFGADYRGDGYRSVHFVVTVDSRPVEIQLRTGVQQTWNRWQHDLIYKGRFKSDRQVIDYATGVSETLLKRETGTCPPPCNLPQCPLELRKEGECFQDLGSN